MEALFVTWLGIALVLALWGFQGVERRVRSWPQPNWTTPGTATEAFAVVMFPLLFTSLFAAAMAILVATAHDTPTGLSGPSPWFALPIVGALLLGYSSVGLAFLKARSAPGDAVRLEPPRLARNLYENERLVLTGSAWMAWQTFHVQGIAARILGLPAWLMHAVRISLLAAGLVLLAIFQLRLAL